MRVGELIGAIVLFIILMATVILCHERDLEVSSRDRLVADLRARLVKVEQRVFTPTIQIGRANVYAGAGEIVVESLDSKP